MSDIKDWSTTAANNNAVPPDGFPEQQAPSTVNNSAREVMAAVRRHYDEIEWRDWGHTIAYASATSFTTGAGDGDTTSIYHDGRRVKAEGATTGTIYGTITNQVHVTQTTVTVSWDSGSLQNEALTIEIGLANDTIHLGGFFATGTKLPFFQAAAPTGWTQDTGNNDAMLRVVSGTGAGTGGTVGISDGHSHQWYDYNGTSADFSWASNGSTSLINTLGGFAKRAIDATNQINNADRLAGNYFTQTVTQKYIDVIVCSKD